MLICKQTHEINYCDIKCLTTRDICHSHVLIRQKYKEENTNVFEDDFNQLVFNVYICKQTHDIIVTV